jgi:aspartate dehydrogenase
MNQGQHSVLPVCLIGYGAIGQAIAQRLVAHERLRISHVVVRPERVGQVQVQLGALFRHHTQAAPAEPCLAVNAVPAEAQLVLECAGHSALMQHVLPSLERGIACATLSIGVFADALCAQALEKAAQAGGAQLHLLSGAVGGIDAIAAAKLAGLRSVRYIGRKPPLAWLGTPAAKQFDLQSLADTAQSAIIFEASARQAAALYPKNANVAATVSLAGLGLDATQVCLIADGAQTENSHEIELEGAFGRMKIEMRNQPLPDNPKTSMLTVLSALRFLENRVAQVVI